jgi:hypothetical protein
MRIFQFKTDTIYFCTQEEVCARLKTLLFTIKDISYRFVNLILKCMFFIIHKYCATSRLASLHDKL